MTNWLRSWMQHRASCISLSTKWKVLLRYAHIPLDFMSTLIKACHSMQARHKKRLYIINTPGWKITNCSRHRIVTLPTRCDARGRADEKFAPFALSRNSSSATYSSCGACGVIPATIHLIASHTWKDQYYTSKQFLKPFGSGSLTSRFYNTSFIEGHAWKQRL